MSVPERRFHSMFGVSPFICAVVWEALESQIPDRAHPRHLLCALLFLKLYVTESVVSTITNMDEETCRKWSWFFVKLIASMHLVSFQTSCIFFITLNTFRGAFDDTEAHGTGATVA